MTDKQISKILGKLEKAMVMLDGVYDDLEACLGGNDKEEDNG